MPTLTPTRGLILSASLVLSLMGPATAALADTVQVTTRCAYGHCERIVRRVEGRGWHRDRYYRPERVHVGQRVHGPWIRWTDYRYLPRPRPYTHYERFGDRVVLVNDNTLQVIAVVGLVSALLATR